MTSLFDGPIGVPAAPPKPKRAPRKKTAPKARTKLGDLPQHVLTKLEDAGAIDASGAGMIATRRARTTFCPTCKQHIVRGLLSMPTPWSVDVDQRALTREGEALALMAGRKTYSLSHRYDHYELDFRSNWDWHHEEPEVGRDIVVQHVCGEPARWPTAETRLPPLKTFTVVELPDDAEPPY